MITQIWYTKITFNTWSFYLATSKKGLCFIGSSPANKQELLRWLAKNYPLASLKEDMEKILPFTNQLKEYLLGERTNFTLPIDLKGTSFQKTVWRQLLNIPYGDTTTYSAIAVKLDNPLSARAVGSAIGKNPLLIVYPCHRVVPKKGQSKGFRGGLEMKQKLLNLEKNHLNKIENN